MKRIVVGVAIKSSLVASALIASAQPVYALPTCEQEIRIRCQGYSVQGLPRLDIYYDSYEECVEQETAAQCPPDRQAIAALRATIQVGLPEKQRMATA